jgi:putative hydrolases of HD superfamily
MDILTDRLKQQLNFLYEIDKLKTVFRRTNLIADPDRLENSVEHSWHLAFYVMILSEYANVKIDLLRVIKMVLIHDIVEIDAGDTFCYDNEADFSKQEKERCAADRLFSILPEDQREEFINLWVEFERSETSEAKFAASVDRLQPFLHNCMTGGGSWQRHDIKRQQVEIRMKPMKEGSLVLAELVNSMLDEAVKNNILKA